MLKEISLEPTPNQLRNAMSRAVDKSRRVCFADRCFGRLNITDVIIVDAGTSNERYLATTVCSRCSRMVYQPATYEQYVNQSRANNRGPLRAAA